jgi:hypothetical protein
VPAIAVELDLARRELGGGLQLSRRKGYLVDTSSTVKVRGPTRAAVEENAKLRRRC